MGSRLSAEKWTSNKLPAAVSILAIVAALLMLPAFLFGTSPHDSAAHNHAWVDGMATEMRKGWIYPRWLSASFEGLGSPSFYFYPPLPFLLMGAVRAAAGDWLPTSAIIQSYGFLLLFASGLAIWWWAQGFMDRSTALVSGIFYMIMPYHLFNFMVRGALGEFAAYAILPALLVAMERMSRNAAAGIPLFAVLYAMLILTHLPMALLVSIFVIPAYALWLHGVRVAAFPAHASLALAGLLGTGLAAAYLIPALNLQEHINAQFWWSGHYDIRDWMIWRFAAREMAFFLLLYSVYGLYGLALIHLMSLMPGDFAQRRRMMFMVIWTWALMLVIAGVVPQIWTGFLAKVQFPWRLIVAVDLLMAVLIVQLAGFHRTGRSLPLSCFAVTSLLITAMSVIFIVQSSADIARLRPAEPPEYRAAGYAVGTIDPAGPVVLPEDAGTVETRWQGEEMIITVSAVKDARVVVPINYFPAWVVADMAGNTVPTEAATPSRLLSFAVTAGDGSFAARRMTLPEERLGWWISLIAALLILAVILFTRRTAPSPS